MTLKNKSVLEDTNKVGTFVNKQTDENGNLLTYWGGLSISNKQSLYSEDEVVSILEFARKNYYDIGEKWHQEPSIDLTSKELIKKYYEQ